MVVAALWLSACTALIPAPPLQAEFDLDADPATTRALRSELRLTQIDVSAPSWLASSAMQYRLGYTVAAARERYRDHRWVAPPAEMLQRMLARTLPIGDHPTTACRLQIELDEFIQVFDTPQQSRAAVAVRVSLVDTRSERAMAAERFEMSDQPAGNDARGAVLAHRALATRLVNAIGSWLEDGPSCH